LFLLNHDGKAAAEFLVPEFAFIEEWNNNPDIKRIARLF
jgi:hypothetical protein